MKGLSGGWFCGKEKSCIVSGSNFAHCTPPILILFITLRMRKESSARKREGVGVGCMREKTVGRHIDMQRNFSTTHRKCLRGATTSGKSSVTLNSTRRNNSSALTFLHRFFITQWGGEKQQGRGTVG